MDLIMELDTAFTKVKNAQSRLNIRREDILLMNETPREVSAAVTTAIDELDVAKVKLAEVLAVLERER